MAATMRAAFYQGSRTFTTGTAPVLTWNGCAVAPDPVGLNSVVGLPDGGFIASNFLPRGGTPAAMQRFCRTGTREGKEPRATVGPLPDS